ncbi:MarR family winged helix-turn-helix transcriptional regulator [Nocardia wallacei]|uniref:MarR family winged helix-turn-helix transcriptional regulator n=1 Tax=Nocardia wallacei TaxID=480035 RepID=UPI002454E4B1|nr:MarR family transcriptional regulator [Nocardia wallacei]
MTNSTTPEFLSLSRRVTWRQMLIVVNQLPGAFDTRLTAALGVTHYEWQILELIAERPERAMRLKEIAALTGTSLSRLSHAVTRLQSTGLAERQRKANTASTFAALTRRGAEIVAQGRPIYAQAVSDLVFGDMLPNEIDSLRRLMAVIAARLETP